MIASIRSKALKRFWTKGEVAALKPQWRKRCALVPVLLDAAADPREMDALGLGFHALSGDMAGRYPVFVSRNWRITFGWNGNDAIEVDLEDYHDTQDSQAAQVHRTQPPRPGAG